MNTAWENARNILCVRLDYLGDVLMCTPALRALKEAGPGRTITLLTSSGGAAVAPFIPEVDTIIEYAAPWMKNSDPHSTGVDLDMMQRLRAASFDAAVIFTAYSQSALPAAYLCYLAGIPLRLAHCRENPYQMLSDWIPEPEPKDTLRHEVRRQLDLVGSVCCYTTDERLSFRVPKADVKWAWQRLSGEGIDLHAPWVVIHPGATAASRRYPVKHWVKVAKELDVAGYPVVFTGSVEETELIDEIIRRAEMHAISLAGGLDLGKLGAVIGLAPAMISSNTGPAHIAAALGTPLVVLYALTNPQHTPWQLDSRVLFHDVPCRFCYKSVCPQGHHECLEKVEPSQVLEAVKQFLHADTVTCDIPDRIARPLDAPSFLPFPLP
ncbi:MAG: lipopolysaccharide heptosyltransferase II [Burkholderiales bacterium]|nr:lipopolysaccharide heptosyltransferase II [Burkholderiales bacterium]